MWWSGGRLARNVSKKNWMVLRDFCALFINCWFSFCCHRSRDEDNMHLMNFFLIKIIDFLFMNKKEMLFYKRKFRYIFWRGTVHGGCRIEIDRKRLVSAFSAAFFIKFCYLEFLFAFNLRFKGIYVILSVKLVNWEWLDKKLCQLLIFFINLIEVWL